VHILVLYEYITGDPYKQTKFPKHWLFGLCLYFGIVNKYKPILEDTVFIKTGLFGLCPYFGIVNNWKPIKQT
jgi:hypothetical protein